MHLAPTIVTFAILILIFILIDNAIQGLGLG